MNIWVSEWTVIKSCTGHTHRQAMNYGFDRQNWSICEIIWVAVNGMIPMGLPSFNNAKAIITTSKKTKN
jgi:peptide/nickel transport system substrate-binding protein